MRERRGRRGESDLDESFPFLHRFCEPNRIVQHVLFEGGGWLLRTREPRTRGRNARLAPDRVSGGGRGVGRSCSSPSLSDTYSLTLFFRRPETRGSGNLVSSTCPWFVLLRAAGEGGRRNAVLFQLRPSTSADPSIALARLSSSRHYATIFAISLALANAEPKVAREFNS